MGKLLPGEGFAEVTAVARGEGSAVAALVRGELGFKPSANSELFGFGEVGLGGTLGGPLAPQWMAGVGARVRW